MARAYLIFIILAGMFGSLLSNGLSRAPRKELSVEEKLELGGYKVTGTGRRLDASPAAEGTVELERSDDGHFYADVQINGTTVRALIDTGASGIALSRDDARSAGIGTSIGMNDVVGRGASGDVHGEYVKLDSVSLGHRRAEGLEAVVLDSGDMTLLGQDFLSRFDSVEIRGDTMLLR